MRHVQLKAWISAMRLRTLPLALSCVLMGGAMAALAGSFKWHVMVLIALTTVLLQVLSNLANDLGDGLKGVDNVERVGPQRAIQSGKISVLGMKKGVAICAFLAFGSGLIMLWIAAGAFNAIFFSFLGLGLVAILAAMAYTLGKRPYGYMGLGDVFVLLFFGVIGVGGSAFLISGLWDLRWIFPCVTIGLLAAGVLNLNNMRDTENDLRHNKMTLAARLGLARAKVYHLVILALAMLSLAIFVVSENRYVLWFVLIPGLMLLPHAAFVRKTTAPSSLDPELKKIALTAFLLSLLMFVISMSV